MQRFAVIVTLLLTMATGSPLAAAPPVVASQELTISLQPDQHRLAGTSTIMLNLPPGTQVNLRISPRAQITGFSLNGIPAPYAFASGILSAVIPECRGKDTTTRLDIEYSCIFNDPIPERIVSFENLDFGVSGIISRQGVFLDGNAGWYPETAEPPERLTVNVTAPAGIEAITQGKRLSRSTTAEKSTSAWETRRPARDLALSAGPFSIAEAKAGTIDIYTYFSQDNQGLAKGYLDAVAEYLKLYQELLGPYPFEKFAVVENFLPTGYGYPSYTLLGSNVIRLPFIKYTSLPHEIVHCWWGNGVLVDYEKGNWSEGLTTYLADYLLEERKSSQAGRAYRFKILADYATLVGTGKDLSLREFVGRHDLATRAVGYGKGAMVFHMARKLTGDTAFFETLRTVAQERMFQEVSWDEFIARFSKAARADIANRLLPFINSTGAPSIEIASVTYQSSKGVWDIAVELAQSGLATTILIPLRLETEASTLNKDVLLDRHKTRVSLAVEDRPKRLLIDPDADVFRLLAPAEIPPAVNRIKGTDALTMVITESCKADRGTLSLLLESLGKKNVPIVAEAAIPADDIAKRDFILCGIPARTDLQPQLPDYITAARERFTANGEHFSATGSLLLAIGANPASAERFIALFLPLSQEAATLGARKITHYGTYGYLVFENGENRKKGQIDAPGGNSVYLFTSKK